MLRLRREYKLSSRKWKQLLRDRDALPDSCKEYKMLQEMACIEYCKLLRLKQCMESLLLEYEELEEMVLQTQEHK